MDHWAGVLTLLTLSLVPCPATSEPVMLLHHQTQAETGFFGTCCEAHRSHFEPICCRTGKFGYFRRICCYSDCQFLSNLLVSANLIFRYYNCLSWILKWGEVLTTEWRVEKVSSRLIDKKGIFIFGKYRLFNFNGFVWSKIPCHDCSWCCDCDCIVWLN